MTPRRESSSQNVLSKWCWASRRTWPKSLKSMSRPAVGPSSGRRRTGSSATKICALTTWRSWTSSMQRPLSNGTATRHWYLSEFSIAIGGPEWLSPSDGKAEEVVYKALATLSVTCISNIWCQTETEYESLCQLRRGASMSYLSAIPVTCSSTFILLARALSEKKNSTTGIAQSIGSTALRVGMHATSKQFHAVADAVRRGTSER